MEKKSPPSKSAEQFIIRFPDGMRDQIAAAAKAHGRSMNAELVARLVKSFNPIEDEDDVLRAVHAIIRYSAKFNVDVTVNFSGSPESTVAKAIRNGSLPADATPDDLSEPKVEKARTRGVPRKPKR
ncbi:Arc family DNA-binding protein [Massilia soli]|uniref:Arc family DNA-binding protein n=1 Tax=Massilia soli TaxID=2792854 RepID=A0ABS7SRC6_9BURK|nr:Arc family DNA-binding protein [Massilia soli]MBZ2208508.1 Arc family DNA-binding protein [Massilia soli]